MNSFRKLTLACIALAALAWVSTITAASPAGQRRDTLRTGKAWLNDLRAEHPMAEFDPTVPPPCGKCGSTTFVTQRQIVEGRPSHGLKTVTTTTDICTKCQRKLVRQIGTKNFRWERSCTASACSVQEGC